MKTKIPAEVWGIDYERAKRGVWWWWFWLAFIENPENPAKPLQLMALWSTKKEKRFKCNGVDIEFDSGVRRNGGRVEFDGVVASWFFDGKKMRDNFVLEQAKLTLHEKRRKLETNGSWFEEKNGNFKVCVEGRGGRLQFSAVPLSGAGESVERVNSFFKKFSYKINKVNEMKLVGTLESNGMKRGIRGTAYFQKVVVRAPVMPWLWGVVHFKDGSFLSYFSSRVGHALIGKDVGKLHRNLHFKSKLEFYCAKDGSYREFRPCKIISVRRRDTPTWIVKAAAHGESLEAELRAYAETSWKIQNGLAGVFKYALHYDEYCVTPKKLVFTKSGGERFLLRDFGSGVGNAEHAWGFLI